MGRDPPTANYYCASACFNPRAHVGRDISSLGFLSLVCRFQSTRPRGARHSPSSALRYGSSFQSTRPRGARRGHFGKLDEARGFQSTRPRGARPTIDNQSMVKIPFQSTRPRGARLTLWAAYSPLVSRFNPRAHVGRDPCAIGPSMRFVCFNPRAHVGRDQVLSPNHAALSRFNPRAHVGRDAGLHQQAPGNLSFNPRAHVGRDLQPLICRLREGTFQSTRPRGARRGAYRHHFRNRRVSIHAPTWGAT